MTYQKLLEELTKLNEDQLQQDVTVYDNECDEYHPAEKLVIETDEFQDVLDCGHPIIRFKIDE